MKLFLLISLALALPLRADPNAFVRTTDQWMQSLDAEKRQAAYRTWLQVGEESMPKYEEALERAKHFHQKAFDELVSDDRRNPFAAHAEISEELDAERERVITLIRTDWKKDSRKVAELANEMEGLVKMTEKLEKAAAVRTDSFDGTVEGHLAALVELEKELERFQDEPEESEEELKDQTTGELREYDTLTEQRQRLERSLKLFSAHESVTKSHEELGRWASDSMKRFAEVLNLNRLALGLGPLELDENLSKAAEGHSEDMAEVGFFAHESPVEGKSSPSDRARLASFSGRFTGENIYMGSSSYQDAYNAWFASDGHRFIMFAENPNTLGVGISGSHWTMMSGKR